MEDFDLAAVSQKSVKGFLALTSRTFLVKILSVVTSFVLTIYLTKSDYGIYFIASSIVVFLVYFQDIGLAASLIQKKTEPTLKEYRTVFTVQQTLVLILIVIAFSFSSQIEHFYHLNQQGSYLFEALVVSFFISSLKTIPTVMLERHLSFNKLVIPDIVENLIYNVSLLLFAIMHFGIASFTIAILTRSIIGLIVIYIIQPWKIGVSFQFSSIKELFKFGIPLQTNSLLALIKDNFINLYIGRVLTLDQVGAIGFAQKLSFLPSNLVMDNVNRVTFPAYSRLQHDPSALKTIVERSLFLVSACILPLVIGFILFSDLFIQYVPVSGYSKWSQSVTSVTFFSLNIFFASLSVPITNFLNAIGKVKVTLYAMVWLSALTWILTPFLIHTVGYNGVAIASFIVAASLIGVVPFAQKYVKFSFWKPLFKPFLAGVVMLLFSIFIRNVITNFVLFIICVIISATLYFAVLSLLAKNDIQKAYSYLSKKGTE